MKFSGVTFLVAAVAAKAADTNAPPMLAPAYGEMPTTFWAPHQSAIIAGGLAGLAFVFLLIKVMLRPKSNVLLPPEVLARQTLAKLQTQPEDGKLLTEISQTLRRYIVAVFALPADEMTTAEFCAALTGAEKIGTGLAKSVSRFLAECDERKFSTAPAVAPLNAAARALEIVTLAEQRRAQISANP
jgi:hypothetical protein